VKRLQQKIVPFGHVSESPHDFDQEVSHCFDFVIGERTLPLMFCFVIFG